MVPGLLVSLTSIIGLLITSQSIVREKELGTIEQLNVTPLTRTQFLAGKLVPFWILAMVIFTIGMTVGVFVFGIPTRGSVPLVFLSAAIYLVVVLGIGLYISTIARTQQQVMFVAFFLLLLFLLLSGIFTPLESAPQWAQWIAAVNPVKYFVFIMRTVLVRGGGLAEVGPTMAGLAAAGVAVMTLAVRQYHKRSE
jgi:ABC-2 type transport system permease protein